jgi:predicted negative regulator of RcsB-dependent stress response
MPKQSKSPRVPKLEHEPDDKFILFVERVVYWGRQNSRTLLIGGVVLAILVLAGIYSIDSQRRVEAEAASRLGEVHQTVMTGNAPLAIRDLQTYLGTFGGTRAAREARLILADLLLAQDRPEDAVQALGRLHRNLDDPVGLAAAQILGAAYEQLGDHENAIDTYRRIAREGRFTFQQREALANAGRVALDTDQPALAADFYEQLIQTFEQGDQARAYYEMLKAEARARADAGPAAAAAAAPAAPVADQEDEQDG